MEKLFLKNEESQIYERISNDNICAIGILKKKKECNRRNIFKK